MKREGIEVKSTKTKEGIETNTRNTKEKEVILHKTIKGKPIQKGQKVNQKNKGKQKKKIIWLKRLIVLNIALLCIVIVSYYWWDKNKVYETLSNQSLAMIEELVEEEGEEEKEEEEKTSHNINEISGKEITVNQMNQEIVINDTFSYEVSSVIRTKQIGDPTFLGAKALENQEYLIVEYVITNNSHKTIEMLNLPMIQLFNIDGTQIPRNKDGFISYVSEVKEESFGVEPLPSDEKITQYEVFLIDSEKLNTEEWIIMSGDTAVAIDLDKVKEMEKI